MTATKSGKEPKALRARFDAIVAITHAFAAEHLNDENRQLLRYAVAALGRKRPSPLASGRAKTRACGVTHAIGMVNSYPSHMDFRFSRCVIRRVWRGGKPPLDDG
jgi:hypothetical protein